MNIQAEKVYIYDMLRDITKERRKLVDMYYDLKQRLDFLNSIEERGIEDLSIKGYVDLHNQNAKEAAVNNLKRETEHQIEKIEKSYIIEESEKSVIPEEEIVKEKLKVRRGRLSREKVESTIKLVLKDAGVPLQLGEIINRASAILDAKVSKTNLQAHIIPELLEQDERFTRPMRGYYQYR
jgi:hypothetical protein